MQGQYFIPLTMSTEISSVKIEDLAKHEVCKADVLPTQDPILYMITNEVTLAAKDGNTHTVKAGTILPLKHEEDGDIMLTVPAIKETPERQFQVTAKEIAKLDDTTDLAQAPSIPAKDEAFHVMAKDFTIIDSDGVFRLILKGTGFYVAEHKGYTDQLIFVVREGDGRIIFFVSKLTGTDQLSVFHTNTFKEQILRVLNHPSGN